MNRKSAVAIASHAGRIGFIAAILLTPAVLMTAFAVKPAAAGNGFDPRYRYCVESGLAPGGPEIPDCSFNTYEQCRATASGFGYCVDNPVYAGPAVGRPQPRPRRAR